MQNNLSPNDTGGHKLWDNEIRDHLVRTQGEIQCVKIKYENEENSVYLKLYLLDI